MPNEERPQDFELIELLIRETRTAPSTSAQQGSDFESFQARFQSYIDQIQSYLHSVGKEGFFPHFFLGSFSTVIDTEIATKLDIEKIYFSFDSSKTLKVALIKKGEIKSLKDATDKVKLFVIAEHSSTKKKFSYGELDKILGDTQVTRNNLVRMARDQDKLGVKLVEITKKKDDKEELSGIFVEVKSDKLDKDTSTTHEFEEIKKGLWSNPESDIVQLGSSKKDEVKDIFGNILGKVSKIHSGYRGEFKEERLIIRDGSLIYAKEAREAAHHGFIAGALVNFRYRHNLRVYLEQFAGRGYADIVLVPRGKDRSLNAVPIIIEMKAATKAELKTGKIGEKSKTTPAAALKQAEDYTKGFQPNVMRILTTANDMLCVGVNFDHPSPVSNIVAKSRDQEITPLLNDIMESIDGRNNGRINEEGLKEKVQNNIERIYHTFPGTGEKGDNHYFSRFLLGQSLLLNEVQVLESSFKKHVFIYGENIPTEAQPEPKSQRLKDQKSKGQGAGQPSHLDQSHGVVTMVFIPSNAQKSVCVMNIVETDGRDNAMNKGIPLDQLQQEIGNRKIVELNLSFNIKKKSKFEEHFSVEVVESVSLEQYNRRETNKFEGNFKDIPYPTEFKETFDRVLESQLVSAQDRSQSIGKYKELFGRLGEAVLPFKVLIEREAHTQAVFHGAFSHYSDIKLGESQENRALVLTEFQTGRGKRIDMVVHGIKFADQASSAKEYDPVGLELKGPREGKTANALKDEANKQIADEYKEGVTYKTLTDGTEVAFMGVVFDKGANNADSLILMSKDEFSSVKIVHSSIFSFSQQQCSKGRKQRSIGMACIDSRSKKEVIEQKREIQKLVGDQVIKKINLKRLEIEILNRYEEIIDDIQSTNKVEILNNAVKSVELARTLSLDQDNKTLQKKAYYNALMDLGALLCDHKNHVYGDCLSALRERIKNNKLFSAAHDLYSLLQNEGSGELYSSKNLKNYNTLEFDATWLSDYFRNSNLEDFQKAYNEEVIILNEPIILDDGSNIYTQTKNSGEKLVIGNYESIRNSENYLLDEETSKIKIISENEEYSLLTGIQGESMEHYFALDYGYKIKVRDVIGGFSNNKVIYDKLCTLELLASKKEIEEMADSKITDNDYDNAIDVLQEEVLKKGVTEEHFNKLKDNLNEEIFVKYVNDIENRLVEHNIEFNSDKFTLAKANAIKGGKLLSLMAVYDLFDSIRDASTLGRYDNSVLKRVFGVNGILDAVNDVRESISISYVHGNRVKTKISPDSIVGKIINKIPDSVRKNLVKIIDNPAVRSITFITIAYQFGYSVKEIVGGNHYPLNYYWAGSSSIKLASMSIRPIAIRVSAVGGRFIRVLSVASKLLGKLSIVTGIADIIITAAIDMHQAKEYLDEVSSHIPLSSPEKYNLFLEKSWSADAVLSVNKKIIKIVSLPRLYCKTKKYFQLTSCMADTDYSYVDK